MPNDRGGDSGPEKAADLRYERLAAVKAKLAECLAELDGLGLGRSAAYVQMGVDALPSDLARPGE